ncbi:MAG: CHAP domain-containing protein [Clostridiales bacterium]|nr:CHAP domain-containing protein [Clostridiales bacterium]
MKKRVITIVIASVFALMTAMPFMSGEAYGAISIRTALPEYGSAAGNTYYYTDNNVFYKYGYGPDREYNKSEGGYVIGNCTWYAYGRASEILGKTLNSNFRWGASQWWNTNKSGNYYSYGSTPKEGAIACYGNHVAIVEKVVNGKPYVSESSWNVSSKQPKSASDLKFHYGTPGCSDLKGYIYIMDDKVTSAATVDFSVKVTEKDLNMRTGPGTGYSRAGYIAPGTYKIVKQSGDWGQVQSNGYWIYLNYATKVEIPVQTSPSTSDGTSSVLYKVNVSDKDLNMRTGPGTNYARKGYITPGTYNIVAETSNWAQLEGSGYWICLTYATKVQTSSTTPSTTTPDTTQSEAQTASYQVSVTHNDLNMRTGPGTSYARKGYIKPGVYTITKTQSGWGQVGENGYWIYLSYTTTVSGIYKVSVGVKDLYQRTGPGTSYSKKGFISPGTYTIVSTENGWGKVSSNGYWIYLQYTTRI